MNINKGLQLANLTAKGRKLLKIYRTLNLKLMKISGKGVLTMFKSEISAESSLHLMVQTPTSLFVYWEITEEFLALVKSALQEEITGVWLRLLKEGEDSPEVVENRIILEQITNGSLYFTGKKPYSTYFAELAAACHAGLFTLIRSVSVLLPPDSRVEERAEGLIISPLAIPPSLPFAYSPTNLQCGRGE